LGSAKNPHVVAEPKIRFYAGVPLSTRDGDSLGTLCVIDLCARELSAGQYLALGALGRMTSAALELHRIVSIIRRVGEEIMDGDVTGRLASELLVRPMMHFWEHMSLLPKLFSLQTRSQFASKEPALALVIKEVEEQTQHLAEVSEALRKIAAKPRSAMLKELQREKARHGFPILEWSSLAQKHYSDALQRQMEADQADAERLAQLVDHERLDMSPEHELDMVVGLAAHMFGTPVAAISVMDDDTQWFKAQVGLEIERTPRAESFCTHAIQQDDVLVVLDARRDVRFRDNPMVNGNPNIRFYAGAKLTSSAGDILGALCIMSPQGRHHFSKDSQAKLKVLARLVGKQMELRRLLLRERQTAQGTVTPEDSNAVMVNAKSDFLDLMAKVASGEMPEEEIMTLAIQVWNETLRSRVLLGSCLRSLRQDLSAPQYRQFLTKLEGFNL
jgi:GAF domain-containing protein